MVTRLTYGSGLGEGISSFGSSLGQALKERMETKRVQDILNPQATQKPPPQKDFANDEEFKQNFLDMIKGHENETGEMLQADQLDLAWNSSLKKAQAEETQQQQKQAGGTPQYSMAQLATIAKKNPQLAKMLQDNQLAQQKITERRNLVQEEREYKANDQVQKEWRDEIKKNVEPFSDTDKLQTNVKQMESAKKLIKDSKKLNLDDNWMRSATQAVLEDKGLNAVGNLAKTDDQRKLYSLMYDFIRSKELGGANPSTKEVMLSLQAKPSQYSGKRGNLAMINMMLQKAERDLQKSKIINKQREKSGPIHPNRFNSNVSEELQPFMNNLEKKYGKEEKILDAQIALKGMQPPKGYKFMVDPDVNVKNIPIKDIKRLQDAGGELLYGK